LTQLIRLYRWPQVGYDAAWRWQAETAAAVRDGADEALALLQHPPVYTLGRRARYDHLLVDAEALRRRGAEVIESDRGGDVTFHGPGQLVAYPILNLRARRLGPVEYVRRLEEVMLQTLAAFGLTGERVPGWPGVWLKGAAGVAKDGWGRASSDRSLSKVGALGVRVQGGVATHGIALNVATDLAWFDAIVPCGLEGVSVTSMARSLGSDPGFDAVADVFVDAFCAVFDASPGLQAGVRPTLEREPALSGR
jgi:lipoate-protein ligase B